MPVLIVLLARLADAGAALRAEKCRRSTHAQMRMSKAAPGRAHAPRFDDVKHDGARQV